MAVCLGIDVGTSGTKALAISPEGAILAAASSNYGCAHPKPLWSEQDPEDWWTATVKVVRAVVKQAKLKPSDVAAIGLSGQMHGSVFLDKAGKVIRPALLWNDQRTAKECAEIESRAGGRAKLIQMVANPALTGFTAPKILWLRNNEPKNFAKTVKVLLPKDEIRRRLTGEFATEVSDASGTLLLDVVHRRWSQPLLDKLELDNSLLPKCYESEEVTGTLTADAAKLLGLTTACKVVGGAGDCAAGAVGNGIVKTGLLATSIGTSGVVFVHSDEPQFDPAGRLHTFCHAVRGKWHMMGVILSAGGSLQWFQDALCSTVGKNGLRKPTASFEELVSEAAATPTGAEGLQFLPYLAGERTPHLDPHARGALIGLTLAHGRGHIVRSILEGVTFALRDSFEIIEGLGVPVKQVRAGGGGAKNPFWRQMQADVFGKAVSAMAADEGPAYGVALLAAVGAGHYQDINQACAAAVKTAESSKPDARARKVYDQAFPVFQGLYRALKGEFPKLG
ncbi:MAG: xylulokinase [Planctomycetaceae bacterium]|nr:xylulokinase [Planctomycetaceae bacterium]